MPRQGGFTMIVGLATIVGAIFSGLAVALYAVDNDWLERLPELRLASKTPAATAGGAVAPRSKPPLPLLISRARSNETDRTGKVTRAGFRTKRTAERRVRARKTSQPRRATVSIFAVAKDIPYPTRD